MLRTEEQAKATWCPWSRVGVYTSTHGASAAVNRHTDNDVIEDTRCLGTGCMAWRWMPKPPAEHRYVFTKEIAEWVLANPLGQTGIDARADRRWAKRARDFLLTLAPERLEGWALEILPPDPDDDNYSLAIRWSRPRPRHGWCGNAGKPTEAE